MKHLLLTTIAAVLLVGCGKPSIHEAAWEGNIAAVKQHLAAGSDVNLKGKFGETPLHWAAHKGRKEIAELLIAKGADVNAKDEGGYTLLDRAGFSKQTEIADLLRKHGGKTRKELENAEPVAEAKESEGKADESDGSEDSEAELLRKMMERRRQEVGE